MRTRVRRKERGIWKRNKKAEKRARPGKRKTKEFTYHQAGFQGCRDSLRHRSR